MAWRAQRGVLLRPIWPRPLKRRRAGARRRRQIPGRAHAQYPEPRRADAAPGAAGARRRRDQRRLCHSGRACAIAGGVHQHGADLDLSRRRPARGDVHHRAPDRHGGGRDGPRSGKTPAQEFHPAQNAALRESDDDALRQRRVRRQHDARAHHDRRRRVREAAARGQEARQAAGPGLRQFHRDGDRHSARARRGQGAPRGPRDHHDRHPAERPGPRDRVCAMHR